MCHDDINVYQIDQIAVVLHELCFQDLEIFRHICFISLFIPCKLLIERLDNFLEITGGFIQQIKRFFENDRVCFLV